MSCTAGYQHGQDAMPDPCHLAAEVSHQEEAVLVLRGRRLAALGMKLAIEQCYVEARGSHNGASVQHAALEAIVRCIQALISMPSLSCTEVLPADTKDRQIAMSASQFLGCLSSCDYTVNNVNC